MRTWRKCPHGVKLKTREAKEYGWALTDCEKCRYDIRATANRAGWEDRGKRPRRSFREWFFGLWEK